MRSVTLLRCAVFGAVLAASTAAGATHPDLEGERGLELSISPGIGGYGTHDEGMFLTAQQVQLGAPLTNAFGGGFALRGSVGWRFVPAFSAGVEAGLQTVSPSGEFPPTEARFGPSDSLFSGHFGVYARFYPIAFLRRNRENPRVFFQGYGDPRRFDPYLSVGVNFIQGISRERTYRDTQNRLENSISYVGIPVVVGLDYRLIQPLAVGLQFGVTPMVAGSSYRLQENHSMTVGIDEVTRVETTFEPFKAGNLGWFVGLSARFTWTLL